MTNPHQKATFKARGFPQRTMWFIKDNGNYTSMRGKLQIPGGFWERKCALKAWCRLNLGNAN